MSEPASPLLDTTQTRLAALFVVAAHGSQTEARLAAWRMLCAFQPQDENELCLAAEIVSFSLHALEALAQSAPADVPLILKIRLRGSAVSLNKEAHRCQRKLEQLRKLRQAKGSAEAARRSADGTSEYAAPVDAAAAFPFTPQHTADAMSALMDAFAAHSHVPTEPCGDVNTIFPESIASTSVAPDGAITPAAAMPDTAASPSGPAATADTRAAGFSADLLETARQAINPAGKNTGRGWTRDFQKRLTIRRITENLRRGAERHTASETETAPGAGAARIAIAL